MSQKIRRKRKIGKKNKNMRDWLLELNTSYCIFLKWNFICSNLKAKLAMVQCCIVWP